MHFQGFNLKNFLGGGGGACPHTPLEAQALWAFVTWVLPIVWDVTGDSFHVMPASKLNDSPASNMFLLQKRYSLKLCIWYVHSVQTAEAKLQNIPPNDMNIRTYQ